VKYPLSFDSKVVSYILETSIKSSLVIFCNGPKVLYCPLVNLNKKKIKYNHYLINYPILLI
jgi:hypothetical protein